MWLCSVGGQSSEIVSLGRLDANRTLKGTISSEALSGVDQRLITGLAEARQRLSIVCRARGGGCCDAVRVSYAVGMKRVARLMAITFSNGRTRQHLLERMHAKVGCLAVTHADFFNT